MRSLTIWVTMLVVAGLPLRATAKKKPAVGVGVFATIDGQKLSAPSLGVADNCVQAYYSLSLGTLTITALECRGRLGKRRTPRRSFQQVILACVPAVPTGPFVPPYDLPCSGTYSESKLRHFVLNQKLWNSSIDFSLGPNNTVVTTAAVNVHLASFDGTTVRGTFTGVFDEPKSGATPATVSIGGVGTFDIPATVQP